jgi:hypothetical protein
MMLVDSRGILLFFPFLLCYFLIFFSFYNSSFGLLSLLTRFPAFLSIIAFKLVIFSMTYLFYSIVTVRSGVPKTHPHREGGNMSTVYFRRHVEKGRSFFELRRSWGSSVCLSLNGRLCYLCWRCIRTVRAVFWECPNVPGGGSLAFFWGGLDGFWSTLNHFVGDIGKKIVHSLERL